MWYIVRFIKSPTYAMILGAVSTEEDDDNGRDLRHFTL